MGFEFLLFVYCFIIAVVNVAVMLNG